MSNVFVMQSGLEGLAWLLSKVDLLTFHPLNLSGFSAQALRNTCLQTSPTLLSICMRQLSKKRERRAVARVPGAPGRDHWRDNSTTVWREAKGVTLISHFSCHLTKWRQIVPFGKRNLKNQFPGWRGRWRGAPGAGLTHDRMALNISPTYT